MPNAPYPSADFATALEACLRQVASGATIEACVARYPESMQQALLHALSAAQALRGTPREPGAAFADRLEHRLRGAVAVRSQRAHARWAWLALPSLTAWGRPALAAALVLLVVARTSVGAVQASEGSLPDSPLYAVKTAIEQVNVATAADEPAKLDVRLRQAPQQMSDFLNATRANRPEPMIQRLVARVAETLTLTVDYAMQSQAAGDPEPNRRVRALIRSLKSRLTQATPGSLVAQLQGLVEEQEQRLPALPRPQRPATPPQPPAARPAQ